MTEQYKIPFNENAVVLKSDYGFLYIENDSLGELCGFSLEDIPNLIKALQKAQELWGDE